VTIAVVAGALANKPRNGGEAWVRLSWVLGLERLGIETWLVEQIGPDACVDEGGEPASVDGSVNRSWFDSVVRRFGLADRAALVDENGRSAAGASSDLLREVTSGADLLINISGNLSWEPLLRGPRVRAYLDLDPGYTQFWHAAGALGGALEQHDVFLTVALSIDRPWCSIPTGDTKWRPVPPPVVLDEWPPVGDGADGRFTTVGSWRGGYGRVEHEGRAYGQKAHEFRRFATVPRHASATFEVALRIDPADRADSDRLAVNGWRLVDPRVAAGDPEAFRRYVQASAAEFSPAQGIYVETSSGWFSDRTTRYLASGKPAVVQETGLPAEIPRGEGLLSFRTVEEAVAGTRDVLEDYERHARAARRLAVESFDSDVVLRALLEDILP
jgi:hypothetical protein